MQHNYTNSLCIGNCRIGTSEADGTWLFRWSLLFNTTSLFVLLVALLVISFVVITVLLLTRNKRGVDVSYKIYVNKLQCLTTSVRAQKSQTENSKNHFGFESL